MQFVNLDGAVKHEGTKELSEVGALSSVRAMTVPRINGLTSVFFVRCRLESADGRLLSDNVYWQSLVDDDPGPPENDNAFALSQESWADFTALDRMAPARVKAAGRVSFSDGWTTVTVRLRNRSRVPAFFIKAEIADGPEGGEILPVTWSDNYVTVFGGEEKTLEARYRTGDAAGRERFLRLKGRNVDPRTIKLR